MGDIKYRIRIVRVDDEMKLYEFEYQMRRKTMTDEERIREDVEMEHHIKTATAEISSSSAFYWHSKDKIVALHTAP